jgi:hypothetical protein
MNHKYLVHGDSLRIHCIHGSPVTLPTPPDANQRLRYRGNPLVRASDFRGAVFSCTPWPAPKCTQVTAIVLGKCSRVGDSTSLADPYLLDTFLGITDAGTCFVIHGSTTDNNIQSGAASVVSGAAKDAQSGHRSRQWVSLTLTDQNGEPLGNEAFLVARDSGALSGGILDRNGFARLDRLPEGGLVVWFPDLVHLHYATRGDSLTSIARRYYHNDNWKAIWACSYNKELRRIRTPDNIEIGDQIAVPQPIAFDLQANQHNDIRASVPVDSILLRYRDSSGNPVAGASWSMYSSRDTGTATSSGQLDDAGQCRIAGVRSTPGSGIVLEKDPQPFVLQVVPSVESSARDVSGPLKTQVQEIVSWVWGTVQGDFNPNQSNSQLAVNTIVGLIPLVDQVLDLRDLTAGLWNLVDYYDESSDDHSELVLGLTKEQWLWVNVFIIAIGCIPGVGSAVKGVLRWMIRQFMKMGKEIGDLSPRELRQLWSVAVAALNQFGVGNAHRELKTFRAKMPEWTANAVSSIERCIDQLKLLTAKTIDQAKELAGKRFPLIGVVLSEADATRAVFWARRRLDGLQRASNRLKTVQAEINQWIESLFAAVIEGKQSQRVAITSGQDVTIVVQKRLPRVSDSLPFHGPKRQPVVKASGSAVVRGETAGTGGIHMIAGVRRADYSYEFVVEGEVLEPLNRARAPNFNRQTSMFLTAEELGVPGWDRAHLWGPVFGDEAAAGIMFAPQAINQRLQKAIELTIRDAREMANSAGGKVKLRAAARSHPTGYGTSFIGQQRGGEFLAEVEYTVRVLDDRGRELSVNRMTLEIGPPPHGKIIELELDGFPVK